MKIHFETEW